MKNIAILAAAAALTTMVASPVLAGDSMNSRHHATKHHTMKHHAHMHSHHRMAYAAHRDDFGPAEVAGGIIGGAIGAAGAVATAPFGGPGYGYNQGYGYGPGYDTGYTYDGVAMPQSANYDARNGFTCRPGTISRPSNGSGVPLVCQ